MKVRPIILAFALPVLVAACASTTDSTKDSGGSAPASSSSSSATPSGTTSGQPSASSSSASMQVSMPSQRSVYYDFDQSDIKTGQRGTIEANAKYLVANPSAKVTVEGNCDERGSREYNLALGQRRSEGVVKMMGLLGVKNGQMEATSLGKEKPKAQGHDESAWQENRRSDIVYR